MPLSKNDLSPQYVIAKVPSHIQGLDQMLHGGLPAGRMTLIAGGPGTGKTIFGLEFVYRSALAGEPGLFVTFEEARDAVLTNARSLGWNLAALEEAQHLRVVNPLLPHTAERSGEFDIHGMLAILGGHMAAIGARHVVIDALDAVLRLFDDPRKEREEFERMHRWLAENNLTSVLTLKAAPDPSRIDAYFDYLADCVLYLDQRITDQIRTRRLAVVKFRGSGFMSKETPFVISRSGLRILPVSGITRFSEPVAGRISSGHEKLDVMLGGGFRPGASVLLAGASGTGKTTLAGLFTRSACRRGQRVLYVTYEEAGEEMVDNIGSSGIDLRPYRGDGTLRVFEEIPESMGAEEHLITVLDIAESAVPTHIVVDAISALRRIGSKQAAFDFLVRLLAYCKKHRITLLLLHQHQGREPLDHISGFGVSSLIDTMITLRYVETAGGMHTQMLVLKSRGSFHSREFHRLTISKRGVHITAAGYAQRPGTEPQLETEV